MYYQFFQIQESIRLPDCIYICSVELRAIHMPVSLLNQRNINRFLIIYNSKSFKQILRLGIFSENHLLQLKLKDDIIKAINRGRDIEHIWIPFMMVFVLIIKLIK